VKFEFLSYCLKINELDGLDDIEDSSSTSVPLYPIVTGNYEYRYFNRYKTKIYTNFKLPINREYLNIKYNKLKTMLYLYT
jgi:hypothetical protein